MASRVEPTIDGVRLEVRAHRARGERIGFVPTMGYLHEGHLALLDRACSHCDFVVLSIFVNPLQFGPQEDLASYPRDLDRDRELASDRGADLIFAPLETEMYPHGAPQVGLSAPHLAHRLCGRYRPGHFEGVLTVVAKLFNIVQPDLAVFGRKDFQQSVLVRQMTRDLNLPVVIDVAPVVREPDGLAMSSRNVYLTPEQRAAAPVLHRALRAAAHAYESGEHNAAGVLAAAYRLLETETGVRVQYLELVDSETLDPIDTVLSGHVLALAAFVGGTRLIDNIVLGE